MWRLLASPKWIALTLVLLVAVAAFGWLGFWQWDRAHPELVPADEQGAADEAEPLAALAQPGLRLPEGSVGRLTTVKGRYDPQNQLLVPRSDGSGSAGFWVVTPLLQPDRSVIPVVRGWSPTAEGAALSPPRGRVTVIGELSRSEDSALRAEVDAQLPEGQVAIVSTAELLSLWQGELYPGFLVLADQDPPSRLAEVAPPTIAPATGVSWQSLAYSLQWWLFAAFAVFFWWRMLQADWSDQEGVTGRSALTEARL